MAFLYFWFEESWCQIILWKILFRSNRSLFNQTSSIITCQRSLFKIYEIFREIFADIFSKIHFFGSTNLRLIRYFENLAPKFSWHLNFRGVCDFLKVSQFSSIRLVCFRSVDFRGSVYEQSKVCLLLGVSIHREIFFENVLPDHAGEWRVMTRPGSFSHSLLPSARFWLVEIWKPF